MNRTINLRNLFVWIALAGAIWLALGPFAAGNIVGARSAAVVLVTLVLWSTGSLPPFLTSLLFFASVLILGLTTPEHAFSGLSSTAVWLIVSGFVIGAAITDCGLGSRLARILAPLLAGSYPRMIFGLTLAAMLLGFVMPSSTGRSVVLVPVGMALADAVGFQKGSKGRIGIAAALALACNMPSFAILPANIPNMILSGSAENLYGQSFGYTDYLALHFPILGILKSILASMLIITVFPDRIGAAKPAQEPDPTIAAPATPANTAAERRVTAVLLVTLALWVTDEVHGINPAWVGLAAAVVLLMPRIGVISARAFNASVDFGIIVFVAAALGLGTLVNETGLGSRVGHELESLLPLAQGHSALNFVSLSVMSALTGVITTIPGVPTVLTPMAQDLANATGLSLSAVLMTQVIGFSTVFFPYQVGPLIIAMQLSGERLSHLLKITLPLAFLTLVVLLPLDYLWWRLLGWL